MTIDYLPATLRKARRDRGLTLKAAAAQSGLSFSFISDVERGKTSPSLDTLEKLAAAYGLELHITLGPVGGYRLGDLVLSAAEIDDLRRWFQERRVLREAREEFRKIGV